MAAESRLPVRNPRRIPVSCAARERDSNDGAPIDRQRYAAIGRAVRSGVGAFEHKDMRAVSA